MAMESAFFNAAQLDDGSYDRVYYAETFARYFASFIGNGVFPTPSNNLQVSPPATPGFTVTVSPGDSWINGYYGWLLAEESITLSGPSGTMDRYDAICVRWNMRTRSIDLFVLEGEPDFTPVKPQPVRNNEYYDLVLAYVHVVRSSTTIGWANIEDTRWNGAVCGVVMGVVDQIDSTTLWQQYDALFYEWFETIQETIDDEVVTNLFNLIYQNQVKIEALEQRVDNIVDELSSGVVVLGPIDQTVQGVKTFNALRTDATLIMLGKDTQAIPLEGYDEAGTSTILGAEAIGTTQGIAIGDKAEARAQWTVALGSSAKVTGVVSAALSPYAEVHGTYSIGAGYKTVIAQGANQSVAIGMTNTINMSNATAIGRYNTVRYQAVAIGSENTSGNANTLIGALNKAITDNDPDFSQHPTKNVLIGQNNRISGTSWKTGCTLIGTQNTSEVGAGVTELANSSRTFVLIGERNTTIDALNSQNLGNVVIGNESSASGSCVAIGRSCRAGSETQVAGTNANGANFTMGNVSFAEGYGSLAFGASTQASGQGASAFGTVATALFHYSTAIGYRAIATSAGNLRLGSVNSSELTTITARVQVTVPSDERDKADIVPLEKGLEFIKKVNPIQYVDNPRADYIDYDNVSEDHNHKRQYGILDYDKAAHARQENKATRKQAGVSAQNTMQALIDTYGTDNYASIVNDSFYKFKRDGEDIPDDVESELTVMHTQFIPFLIDAVKTLSEQNEALAARVADLEARK